MQILALCDICNAVLVRCYCIQCKCQVYAITAESVELGQRILQHNIGRNCT